MKYPFASTIVTVVDNKTLMLPPLVGEISNDLMMQIIRGLTGKWDFRRENGYAVKVGNVLFRSSDHNAPIVLTASLPAGEYHAELTTNDEGGIAVLLIGNNAETKFMDEYDATALNLDAYDMSFVARESIGPRQSITYLSRYERKGVLSLGRYNVIETRPSPTVERRASVDSLNRMDGYTFQLGGTERGYGSIEVSHQQDGSSHVSFVLSQTPDELVRKSNSDGESDHVPTRYLRNDSAVVIGIERDTVNLQHVTQNDEGMRSVPTLITCTTDITAVKFIGFIY